MIEDSDPLEAPIGIQVSAWHEQRSRNQLLAQVGAGLPAPNVAHIAQIRSNRINGGGGLPAAVRSEAGLDDMIPGPAGPIPVRLFVPEVVRGLYVHFHGGGWVFGSIWENDPMLWSIAQATGLAVVTVGYRLAPEHPYPAAVDDAEAAVLWAIDNSQSIFGTRTIVLGGESAGAHVAVMALLRLRDQHDCVDRIAAVNLSYGIYDLGMSESQRNWGDRVVILSTPWLQWFYDQFTPGMSKRARRAPNVSPLFANLVDLPPALFIVGTEDPLLDDSVLMAQAWGLAGNATTLALHPHGPHGVNVQPTAIGKLARDQILAFLNSAIPPHCAPSEADSVDAMSVLAQWRDAVERNDMTALAALYSPDAQVWTSPERRYRPLAEHLLLVSEARSRCSEWAYVDIRSESTRGGFLSRHEVRLVSNGTERRTVAAIFGTVRDGRITELSEYFNRRIESLD